ncbi:hypothetical protein JBL43_05600 [Aureibaculum sp. A20]|uniref:Lipoprotein n=1 Tax=Aureibaculum flavum TaxID=2795986 RepID=A0ABS0WNY9_9FLAO|nr:hypothetical protein [Aureibaculum flavum]MBJ2173702.1 hypothetical protein [Aureibaculum flavum]
MKNNVYFLWIALAFFLTSCNWLTSDVEIKKQTYFLDVIDSVQTKQSKKIIAEVYSQLQNKEFVLSLKKNDWNGILPYNAEVDLSDLSEYYPEIHVFKALKSDSDIDEYMVKIELLYNKLLADNIPNFTIKMYLRNADNQSWKPFANPGNFRFNTEYYKENKQAEWIKRIIVGLTFK